MVDTIPQNGNGRSHVLNKEQFEAKLQSWVENSLADRTRFFSRVMDPRRDLDSDCGYPDSGTLDAWYYKALFDREPLAARVVELMPKESWQVTPTVYEDEDPDVVTPFEEAWDNLSKQLRGESWFQDEDGSPVWEYLYRVDKLSGIGGYGVLLLGFDDGRPLYEPLEGMTTDKPPTRNMAFQASVPYVTPKEIEFVTQANSDMKSGGGQLTINLSRSPKDVIERMGFATGVEAQYQGPFDAFGAYQYPSVGVWKKGRKLLFMRPFDESLCQITQFESNPFSPRYGQPIMYRITMNDINEYRGGTGLSLATLQVHWTRVIHVADNKNASEVFSVPRMRPVLNPLLDVRKVRGGSAEMYWKGAFPGVALSTHPQLGGDVPVDQSSMKDMMENYANTLQRYLLLVGMSASTLSPTVVDPTGQITAQIEAICIQLGCPVRVFRGSERGELASSQDDSAWNDRLRHRQNMYLTPNLIVPFVDRLIKSGVLPEPTKGKDRNRIEDEVKKLKAAGKTVTPPAEADTPDGLDTPQKGAGAKPFGGGKPGGFPKPTGNYLVVRNADGKVEGVITKGGYSVEWPDLDSLGEKDKSTVAMSYTTALAAYKSGGVEELMDFQSYLVNVLDWSDERAASVVWASQKSMLEDLQDQPDLASKAEESDLVPTPPAGFENKPEPPPPMPGMPGGPPVPPVKMGAGESLVHPETGKTVAKTPFPPKPPTKNVEEQAVVWNSLKDAYEHERSMGESGEDYLEQMILNFVDSQPRAEDGKWTAGGEATAATMEDHKKQVMKDIEAHGLYKGPTGEAQARQEAHVAKADKYLRKQLGLSKKQWAKAKEEAAKDPKQAAHDIIAFAGKTASRNADGTVNWAPMVSNYDEEDEDDLIDARQRATENRYTFSAEDCPECGASMEGDPYSGKCNSCGHKWGKEITDNCGGPGGSMGPCPAGDRLRELSAKSITDAHDPAELKAHMDELGKMSGKELKDVAKDFGINQTQGSKGELLQRIGDKVKMRREMYERTKVHGTTNEEYDDVEMVENEESDREMYLRFRRQIEGDL